MAASYLLQIILFITCFEAFFTQDDQRSSSVTYTLNFDEESPETAVKVPESFNVQKTIFVKPNNDIKEIEGARAIDTKASELVKTKIVPPHRFLFPKYSRDFIQMYRNQIIPELQVGCEEGFTSPRKKEDETKSNIRKPRDVTDQQNKTRVARQIYPIYPIPVPIYDYPRYVDPNPYYWRSYPSTPYPWQQPPPLPPPTPAAAIYPIPFYPGIQPPSWSFRFQPPRHHPRDWPNRARNIPTYDLDNRHNNQLTPTYVNPNEDRQYPYPPRLSNDEVRRRLGWSTTTTRPNQIPQNPAEICTSDYIRNCPGITRIDGEVNRPPLDGNALPGPSTQPNIPPYPPARKPTLPPPIFTITTTPTTTTTHHTTRRPTLRPSRPSTTSRPRKPEMANCQESDLTKCPGFTNININPNKQPIPPFIPPPSFSRPPPTTTTPSTTSTPLGSAETPCESDDISECPGFSDLNINLPQRPPENGSDYGDGEDEDFPGNDEEEELLVVPPSVKEKESFNYDIGIPEDCVEDDITKCKEYNPVTIPPPPSRPPQTPHAVHCAENDITKCPGFSKLLVEKPPPPPHQSRDDEREKRDNAGRCVWAIVTCCKRDAESIRKGCFTIMGCPETQWKDLDPCGEPFSQKTLAVTKKYFR